MTWNVKTIEIDNLRPKENVLNPASNKVKAKEVRSPPARSDNDLSCTSDNENESFGECGYLSVNKESDYD